MVTLKILGVSFNYNGIKALENVTFNVEAGEVVSIIGPNGAGKTTLLKCIAKLLKPKHGTILIDNRNLDLFKRVELAKLIGYVPQLEETRFPLTVFEWILLGRKPYMGMKPSKKDLAIVENVIEELKMKRLAFRKVNELSGGEWRKTIVARALAQEPKILLLDEPTNHLDLKHQVEVLKLIRESAIKKKLCVIIATHDVNLALRFSDKIIVLNEGKIVFCGNVKLLKREVLEKAYDVKIEMLHDTNGYPIVVPKTEA
ncbi:MAG: iron ABC transporter ATP-binding protein [Thermoprotei archaeon]|nr:MAG: iron ABC transporter ATP-binding protein [Thermoprotei archaeon]